MPAITEFTPGAFCWVDSGTTDVAQAQAFYAAVFGWEFTTADDTGYTMCLKAGLPVAGLYPLSPEMVERGAGPYWAAYVAVADADATMARAVAAGARPMGPVFEAPGHGKGGAFADPAGALIGIWQGSGHRGFGLRGEDGTMSWCELQTPDADAAAAFYAAAFDWSRETVPMPEGEYHIFRVGGQQIGGMMALPPAMADVPPNWSIYLGTADADATVTRALAAGGTVVVPVTPIPTVGRFAVLRSADGAYFSILQPAPMA